MRTCHNFTGLGIDDPHYLFMISIVGGMPLRPPAQLFQPLSHLNSIFFTSIAKFTVWTVDSQEGQQVASYLHDHLAGCSPFASRRAAPQVAGTALRRGATYYATR
jgi:hypothetical protein